MALPSLPISCKGNIGKDVSVPKLLEQGIIYIILISVQPVGQLPLSAYPSLSKENICKKLSFSCYFREKGLAVTLCIFGKVGITSPPFLLDLRSWFDWTYFCVSGRTIVQRIFQFPDSTRIYIKWKSRKWEWDSFSIVNYIVKRQQLPHLLLC